MRTMLMRLASIALLVGGGTACTDYLTGSKSGGDPNNPAQATIDQLMVGIQAAQFTEQEGFPAFIVCLWMQQCQGVGGRFVQQLSQYAFTDATTNADFAAVYVSGGLIDIRNVERLADARGDEKYKGVAEVWEAFVIGTATDLWGDLPYRDAVGSDVTPTLDPQLQIYDDLEALLDQAITDLQGAGTGPGAVDLIYGGDISAWLEAAHTLKARYYLHTVEARGTSAYQNAIVAAQQGISSPANDFRTLHTSATFERNIWYQFNVNSGFGEDLVAGATLVNLMNARNDPRRAEYFSPTASGKYGGVDVNGNVGPNGISLLEGTRNDPTFRQPLITNDENLLILAEANFVLNGAAAAQPFLDQERDNHALSHAPATLQTIMEDKYIALFQNVEVFSDWKRTCIPQLTPFSNATFNGQIPGRFYYGSSERSTNPNIPAVSQQLAHGGDVVSNAGINGFRNPNDPVVCP